MHVESNKTAGLVNQVYGGGAKLNGVAEWLTWFMWTMLVNGEEARGEC